MSNTKYQGQTSQKLLSELKKWIHDISNSNKYTSNEWSEWESEWEILTSLVMDKFALDKNINSLQNAGLILTKDGKYTKSFKKYEEILKLNYNNDINQCDNFELLSNLTNSYIHSTLNEYDVNIYLKKSYKYAKRAIEVGLASCSNNQKVIEIITILVNLFRIADEELKELDIVKKKLTNDRKKLINKIEELTNDISNTINTSNKKKDSLEVANAYNTTLEALKIIHDDFESLTITKQQLELELDTLKNRNNELFKTINWK